MFSIFRQQHFILGVLDEVYLIEEVIECLEII